jgi:putative flippase GtrA
VTAPPRSTNATRVGTLTAVSEKAIATRPRLGVRIRLGMRSSTNWLQFARYAIVGVSGYAVSIATFSVLFHLASLTYWLAATGAFVCALINNFLFNRHWTFRARDGHFGFQAGRFVVINIGAFIFSLGVLHVLIDGAGVPPVTAQAIAVLAAAPPHYVGHRIWSFRA